MNRNLLFKDIFFVQSKMEYLLLSFNLKGKYVAFKQSYHKISLEIYILLIKHIFHNFKIIINHKLI